METGVSSSLMGHLAQIQTLPLPYLACLIKLKLSWAVYSNVIQVVCCYLMPLLQFAFIIILDTSWLSSNECSENHSATVSLFI